MSEKNKMVTVSLPAMMATPGKIEEAISRRRLEFEARVRDKRKGMKRVKRDYWYGGGSHNYK